MRSVRGLTGAGIDHDSVVLGGECVEEFWPASAHCGTIPSTSRK
jgi:hypothetical protein